MRRASTLAAAALAATGAMALAGAAPAQTIPTAGQAQGLRYLTWQGRGEAPAPASRDAVRSAQPAAARTDLRRPNPVIPHGGFATAEPTAPSPLTPAPGPARRTLTPANAWLQPRPAPPEPAPAPISAPAAAVAPLPPTAPAPRPARGPDYLPDQGRRAQPAPAEAVYAAPVQDDGASATLADPMAPRRDAPIFRMQQTPPPQPQAAPTIAPAAPAPLSPRAEAERAGATVPSRPVVEVAASGEGPPRQGGRYYSVHRQNGREPDALSMPQPTYVDALVVSSIDTLASQDLAEPEPGPTLIRDRNGSMRPVPASSDGDHQ